MAVCNTNSPSPFGLNNVCAYERLQSPTRPRYRWCMTPRSQGFLWWCHCCREMGWDDVMASVGPFPAAKWVKPTMVWISWPGEIRHTGRRLRFLSRCGSQTADTAWLKWWSHMQQDIYTDNCLEASSSYPHVICVTRSLIRQTVNEMEMNVVQRLVVVARSG